MKKLIMMCGLPRSGKTTWIEQEQPKGSVVLSADTLRYLVYNQRFWADGESLMWSVHSIILKMLMRQGTSIVIDETNMTPKRRHPIIKMAQEHGYCVECVLITTPKESCIDRASYLNDEVIKPVIERMANEFVKPELAEGFDKITEV